MTRDDGGATKARMVTGAANATHWRQAEPETPGLAPMWRGGGVGQGCETVPVSLALAAIIISAVTLTWTVGWSVYTHRRATKPSIVLGAAWAYPVYDMPGGGTHVGTRTIDATATNTGQATVTLASCKVLIRGKPKTDSIAPMAWVVQSPGPLWQVRNPGVEAYVIRAAE